MSDITVVIPTHPGRDVNMLARAIHSVWAQTRKPDVVIVSQDLERRGAGHTRNKGLFAANTTYTAFLDSDDELLPDHLDTLWQAMEADRATIMAYSWFEPVGMPDPLGHFGLPFNIETPHHTTVTTMVDTYAAQAAGGFPEQGEGSTDGCLNDDWIFLLRMCEYAKQGVGAYGEPGKIVHVPKKTWRYHGHSSNTSGKPGRGDAK